MLLIGAVDVNVAVAGVGVVLFEAVEPQDAGEDVVLVRGAAVPKADDFAAFENGARGGIVAYHLADAEFSQRGEVALRHAAEAVFGGGAGVLLYQ